MAPRYFTKGADLVEKPDKSFFFRYFFWFSHKRRINRVEALVKKRFKSLGLYFLFTETIILVMGQASLQETDGIPRGRMGIEKVVTAAELQDIENSGQGVQIIGDPGQRYEFTTIDFQDTGEENLYEGTLGPGEFLVRRFTRLSELLK